MVGSSSSIRGSSGCCVRVLDLGVGCGEWTRVRVGEGRVVGSWVTRDWEIVGVGVGVSLGVSVSSGVRAGSVDGSALGSATGSSVSSGPCCPAGAQSAAVEHAASGFELTEDDTIQPPATASTTIATMARMSRLFWLPFSSSSSSPVHPEPRKPRRSSLSGSCSPSRSQPSSSGRA